MPKHSHANIPIFIPHLGCPNDCVFCNQRTISGHSDFDPEGVRGEIETALATVGDRDTEIAFFGGSFTGIDICFIGESDFVDDEIIRSGREIADLIEETNDEDANAKDANVMVADTSVMREVLFAIGNLQEDKKIKCSCGSNAVKVLLDYDKAAVICKVCGKKKEIAARTRFDANAAIDLDEIVIS